MNTTRQDAWSRDEDILLAETVLRYIREGKTQLEAFKNVAKQLSRTSAACGFRWNATIRKQYHHAIQLAKAARKSNHEQDHWEFAETNDEQEGNPIDTAILLLKKLRLTDTEQEAAASTDDKKQLQQLQTENEMLKKQLATFDSAWEEMGKLWMWVKENRP